MGRPKKFPTKPVRINVDVIVMARKKAKKRGMSLPDYLTMRLTQ